MNKLIITILLFILIMPEIVFGQLVNIKGNAQFYLSSGSTVQINGGLRIDNSASLVHQNGALSYLNISGKFELYGTYTQNSDGRITFNKGAIDTIAGNSALTIARIYIDKSNNNRVVLDPNTDLTITEYLYLLNSSLELVDSDLLLNPWAKIYSSLANDTNLTTFNANKCIINSGSAIDPLLGGRVVRKFTNTLSLPQLFQFPIGTPGYYSPAEIELRSSGATFGTNPEISVKPVDQEHPEVEVEDKSLIKYWVVNSNDVNVAASGANVKFYYNAGEVAGNESNYRVIYYSPSYDDPNGYWRLDPGNDNDIVDFNQRFFYSTKVDSIKGDWGAGEPEVSAAIYYSRQNGDWDDPNTWSKVNFGGAASTTIPNKQSDKIRIKGHTVTIDAQPAPFRALSLEKDVNLSKLIIQSNFYLTGDSTVIQDSTYLSFAHADGIAPVPTNTGCIRTSLRSLSSNAFYEFSGAGNQNSGTGLPNVVRSLIINKDNEADTVKLQKNIAISQELKINEGSFDVSSFAVDGASASRTITMNSGELILRAGFPANYTSPTFTAGKITFAGTGNAVIPSSSSTPAVNQYHKLKIAGSARAGNITFPNNGEIRIKDSLDISSLTFTNNTYKFLTDGSTVVFNKVGGIQYIPLKPASPADTVVYLQYFNLILDSTGTKQLLATGTPTFKVLNDITLRNSTNFATDNQNLEVQGGWLNQSGATFTPGNATVIMRSAVQLVTETITSRDTTDNAFNNLVIAGAGIVKANDNLKVLGNLTIDTTSFFGLNSNQLSLYGDFIVNGGTHVVGTSTVKLLGNIQQNIISTSADVPFNNLYIDNSQGVLATSIGSNSSGLLISDTLTLDDGNLIVHSGSNYRFVQVSNVVNKIGSGFVDGELRKSIATGASTVNYEVGHLLNYTPVTLEFTGTGGTSGFLGILSDTLGVSSTPISWTDATPSDINPSGSTLSMPKHVARQIGILKPSGSIFDLGASREYNITVNFNAGDIRNSADYTKFSGRLWNGSNWITPFYYGAKPIVGTLTPTSFQYSQLKDLGTLVFGEPGLVTYYSRASGNWNVASNWSNQGYGGTASTSYPGQISNSVKVYIGDGDSIALNLNFTLANSIGDSAFVQVDSSGILNLQDFIISGNGAFRLMKYSTIEIGNSDGIAQTGATGNIQTGTRNYNYGTHNLGTFVYNGSTNQTTGLGIPTTVGVDSIYKLIINKPVGTVLTQSTGVNDFHIKDSLFLISGEFQSNIEDLYVYHVVKKLADGELNVPTGRTLFFRGNEQIFLIAENYNDPIVVSNVDIFKGYNTGDVILGTNTNLKIIENLNFAANNKVLIDATTYTSQSNPLYVEIDGTVTGAGHIDFTNSGGWVWGEVKKTLAAGADSVYFETGTSIYYSPFGIEMLGAGGTAGTLSGSAIPGNHPKLYDSPSTLYPISPSRNITVYWRLKKPAGSTFDRGTRAANYIVRFINPDQQTNTDCFGCADVAFYRGGDSLSWWQGMYRNSSYDNSGINNYCGDTRIAPHPTPNFNYGGDDCGSTALLGTIKVLSVPSTLSFGTTDFYSNGDLLLAEFVAGNRNSIKYYKFYSIKDGDWSDPTTWSTTGYNGTINEAALDNDPKIRPIPCRQYDNVYIGNGKKVKLDVNIGTNVHSDPFERYAFAGPSVFVENTGTIDLTTCVIRGNQFNAQAGSTLIIGSNDGISSTNSPTNGNIQLSNFSITSPNYNDSINVVYAPSGRTSNGSTRPLVNRNSLTHYIESVTIRKASDNSIVMQYVSGNKFLNSGYANIRSLASCSLEVGQQYYIQINPSNVATNRKYKVFADWNWDGDMADGGETPSNDNSADTVLVTTSTFTVPNIDKGSTQLRIGMSGNASNFNWNSNNTNINTSGEFEDYTIHIINPNYAAYQVNGDGLPTLLQSLTVHSPNPAAANPQFTLGKSITVIDDITIKSGKFNQGAVDINLYGDFINDTLNGFVAHPTNPVKFLGEFTQNIGGTHPITFNNIEINKTGSNPVNVNNNLIINGTLTHSTDNKIVLNPNNTITFGRTGNITPGSGSFSENRMIETDAISDISKVIKNFYPSANYCIPSLRWGTTTDHFITNVTYGTLNNTSGKSSYSDFTYLAPPTITAGVATNITIAKNTGGNRRWYVWVDSDKDGLFENIPSERLIDNANASGINQNITIPITALNGLTRMRIKMRNGSNNNSCETALNIEGEYEDYLINIVGGTDLPNQNYTFNFPIGANNIYSPANFVLKATQTGAPSISVLIKDEKHPDRLLSGTFTEDVLSRYWRVSSVGIQDVVADSLYFQYDDVDVNGNESKYIPARYNGNWEINLGYLPKVMDNRIRIFPSSPDTLASLDGDWTAGVPEALFFGRKFYSINNGDWNIPANWSNVSHTGPRSQYFPGDIFSRDTVHIDGHTINFKDSVNITIDSLLIGGTNLAPGQGILSFGVTPNAKSLTLRQIATDEDGLITGIAGTRQDTIVIKGSFFNNSNALQSFRNDLSSATHLKFIDTANSRITGSGNFGRLGNVILDKDGGLLDTLYIDATNFALASDTTLDYTIIFDSGFLSHNVNTDLYLSSGQSAIDMNQNTGIGVFNGSIRSNATITSNFNTNFQIDGGDFIIGDAADDNFLYKTGTTFNVIDGDVAIAGVFGRALPTSLIDFTMLGNNDIKVLTEGNTDASKIGFDISNSGSLFSMSDGRIIIANAGGATPSTADYNISAQNGTGMIGGVLQAGDSTLTPAGTTIKLAGTSPVYDLHFANNALNNLQTQITESIFTITNDWTIDANHSFDLDGNTVRLAGDLTNYGSFTAVPSGPTANPYQIELNGSGNQILFSNLAPLEVYKLSVNKNSGNVVLDATGNSNLIIRNALEFTSTNQAFIDASATNRYVELSPTPDSDPTVFRVGLGHVYGRLYRYIPTGNAVVEYPVGADTIASYRPATFSTIGSGGTAGLVGISHFPIAHPDTITAPFIAYQSILKYWNVDDPSAFDLDTRTFDLTLQYINPNDLNGSVPQLLDMYRYTPPVPAAGTWSELSSPFKSDTTVRSTNNTIFGDFAIGEPNGLTFYSYNSGDWSDINTWSLSGYTTLTVPTRFPNEKTDIVRIGNGKAVTISDVNFEDTLKSVIVERFNNLPGELYINGTLNFIRGNSFILEDSCTLGIQHINGISPASAGNSGVIQTNSRSYGVSRYVYNSNVGSTITGFGLPDSVKSIIIDMPNTTNKTVFVSNSASPNIKIQDSLVIRQGEFSPNTRFIEINKVLELDTVVNNGRLNPGNGTFIFPNNNDKYIILKNRSGVTFYDLEVTNGNVIVKRPSAPLPDSSHVYVNNVLNFSGSNSKFEINDDVNLEIKNSSVNSILNFNNQNFVRIGVNGGYLIRKIDPSLSYTFPIGLLDGVSNEYNPVTFDGLTGTAGKLGARVDFGSGTNFAHIGASGIPSSSFIQKYWTIDSTTLQIAGKLRFFYNDDDIINTETEITKIGRWNPVQETTPGNWTFPFNPSNYDHTANYFETTTNYDFSEFRGDWAFGSENYFRRLFFSRQNGNWDDENTWTYNSNHIGPIFGTGMWPNFPNDSVTIGGGVNGIGNHIVVLNVDLPFSVATNVGIAVGTGTSNTGTLDFGTNNLNGNRFILRDLSTLIIGSPDGITTVPNAAGNLRTTDTRDYSTNGKYHYRGLVDQVSGNGLPNAVNTLIADNQGVANNNTLTLNASVDISDSLIVRSGRMDIGTTNNVNTTSLTAHFRVYPNAIFAMGGTLNMLTAANNYQTYNLEDDSFVEFYGANQVISDLPLTFTQSFVSNTGGFGNIITTEVGTKTISSQLLMRNDLINRNSSLLSITGPVNSVRVLGNVTNSASIYNEGIIELGN